MVVFLNKKTPRSFDRHRVRGVTKKPKFYNKNLIYEGSTCVN